VILWHGRRQIQIMVLFDRGRGSWSRSTPHSPQPTALNHFQPVDRRRAVRSIGALRRLPKFAVSQWLFAKKIVVYKWLLQPYRTARKADNYQIADYQIFKFVAK